MLVWAMSFTPTKETLAEAAALVAKGDFVGAGKLAESLLIGSKGSDAESLHILGLVKAQQGQFEEAVSLLRWSLTIAPRQPQAQCNLGKALARLGRTDEAVLALRAAIKLKPDLPEALFELGVCLQAAGRLEEAESAYRKLLRLKPSDADAKLALGNVLLGANKLDEAATAFQRGMDEPAQAAFTARLQAGLARVRRRQGRQEEALAGLEQAARLDPSLKLIEIERAELLHDLKRFDEALDLYRSLLARDPFNVALHHDYNDLLYRLDRKEDYLKSFDRAPPSPALNFAKATLLMHGRRYEEAAEAFTVLRQKNQGDKHAGVGLATALSRLGRHDQATALFETLVEQHPADANLCGNAAAAAIARGDAARALTLCERGHVLEPDNQVCLALMSPALRLLGDERDEALSGYDSLIRVFDLDPPDGFADMASFNAELDAYLDRLHPHQREHVAQSLRGGSQTIEQVFGAGHDLIDRLEQRIRQAMERYIAEMPADERHPFLSRRRRGFAYSGSWSSRLSTKGFHANHFHPEGWISSCYYVAVPEAVKDENLRQGWLKFGEPDFACPLEQAVRRALQPVPGRLVLFPSYLWHGTIPFRGGAARTTIAFDAVPGQD
jgi:tetratricopeptide (TPR) repeat protein